MPFPWKKVKNTRISQFVNDHLHKSQKRRDGSSLMVATGFPTSLIDLIIKNRENLKKQSKRPRQNPPNTPISGGNDPSFAGSPTSLSSPSPARPSSFEVSSTPSSSPSRCPPAVQKPLLLPLPSSCVGEISVVGLSDKGTFVGVDEKEVSDQVHLNVNRVLLGVLKMFLVVGLALGVKRLTVGITLSAFLLLFLEYVGKAEGKLRSMVRSVLRLLRYKEVRLDEKKEGALMNLGSSSLKSQGYLDQEIQVVGPKVNLATHMDEIQPVNDIMEVSCFAKGLGYQEIERMEMVMEKEESMCDVAIYKRKSRRAKIKSKMKKLLPKKFKTFRKDHGFQRNEIVKDGSVVSYDKQAEVCENERTSEIASDISSVSGGRYREEDGATEISACGRLSEVSEEAGTMKREKVHGVEAGLAWTHLALCLIVLTGLIGGRVSALVLTLSWFLLLKLGETLSRYVKFSVIKSCSDKSD